MYRTNAASKFFVTITKFRGIIGCCPVAQTHSSNRIITGTHIAHIIMMLTLMCVCVCVRCADNRIESLSPHTLAVCWLPAPHHASSCGAIASQCTNNNTQRKCKQTAYYFNIEKKKKKRDQKHGTMCVCMCNHNNHTRCGAAFVGGRRVYLARADSYDHARATRQVSDERKPCSPHTSRKMRVRFCCCCLCVCVYLGLPKM